MSPGCVPPSLLRAGGGAAMRQQKGMSPSLLTFSPPPQLSSSSLRDYLPVADFFGYNAVTREYIVRLEGKNSKRFLRTQPPRLGTHYM